MPVIFLIIATTITKNSTKKLDKEIFQLKENIRILDDRYELTLLDYSILTSPKKLMEYQQFYFEDKFVQKKIENLSKIEFLADKAPEYDRKWKRTKLPIKTKFVKRY